MYCCQEMEMSHILMAIWFIKKHRELLRFVSCFGHFLGGGGVHGFVLYFQGMKTPFTLTLFFVLLSGICGALPTDSSLFAHWTFDGTTDDFTYRANHLAHMDGSWHTPTYKPGRDSVANKAIQLASYGCKVISYIPSEENKPLQLDSGSNSWSVAA